jgi:hypothetical protein
LRARKGTRAYQLGIKTAYSRGVSLRDFADSRTNDPDRNSLNAALVPASSSAGADREQREKNPVTNEKTASAATPSAANSAAGTPEWLRAASNGRERRCGEERDPCYWGRISVRGNRVFRRL